MGWCEQADRDQCPACLAAAGRRELLDQMLADAVADIYAFDQVLSHLDDTLAAPGA